MEIGRDEVREMKRYQTQVSDWMTSNPVTIAADASLAAAYQLMRESEIRRLLVIDDGQLGIVTMSDILQAIPSIVDDEDSETKLLASTQTVGELATWDPITVDSEDTIQEAAERMLEYRVSGLPVINGSAPVGIITESDIFRLVVESWSDQR